MRVTVPVIQYHKIDEPSPNARVRGGFTPPERFARQMTHLKSRGYTFHTASELIEFYKIHAKFPPHGISITFDDGCRDNFTNAFPVLRKLGIKATFFIVPSCIGEISSKTQPNGEEARPHLSREEIREMRQFGMEFGSHTVNHLLLHEIPIQDARYEIENAKSLIEDLLQTPCKTLAYPAGFYTPEVQRIIGAAGHICAFSTTLGPADRIDLFAINRIEILRRDRFLFQFARKLRTLEMPSPN
jgi:peptidoglycan/xylan/chitin deacetylase (PgdA/CDA1 family)